MLRGFFVRFRRAHHPQLAPVAIGKKRRAEIVAAHVRGEQDGAGRGRELIEILRALHRVGEFRARDFVIGRIGDRPGEVEKRQPGAAVVR